ncbi:MAG: hypothetical protein Q8N73_02380 [bacterium]|nr:hypothetical protein [bacterium]
MRNLFLFIFLAVVLGFAFESQAVTVGPVKLDYSVDPGDVIEGEFFLMNEGNETQTFYPDFEKFKEENGEKIFLKEKSDLATWIKTDSSVSLGPGAQKNVAFKIEIPKNAPPGGHFAVVWWGTAPPGDGGQVTIAVRAGILLLIRVSGDIQEEGRILSFQTANSKKIFWSAPVGFQIVFNNDGNVHLKPAGTITIKNILGRVSGEITVNPYALQVLPQSKRTFEEKWTPPRFAFGLYKAEVNFVFGESQKNASQGFWFLFIPLKTLVLIILILVLIFFILPKGIKKYNQWVIAKAREGIAEDKKRKRE